MNETQSGSGNLLDTTDCLEAVGVFKGWKNFFFIVLILCIALLQACFWLVDTGMIPITPGSSAGKELSAPQPNLPVAGANNVTPGVETPNLPTTEEPNTTEGSVVPPVTSPPAEQEKTPEANEPNTPAGVSEPSETDEAGGLVMLFTETTVPSPNEPSGSAPAEKKFLYGIGFEHVVWIIRFVNSIFVLVAVLYCLTMMFSLKVSMLGRLGGINHITRAFFLSLILLILVLPWQVIFGHNVVGAIFTSGELIKWQGEKTGDTLNTTLYYLRFCGYMVLIFLLLILAQIRSGRWAKAILRRLEII